MNKSYQQNYKQQQKIEKQISFNFGYRQSSVSMDHKQKKKKQNSNIKVANITPRTFGIELKKTDKIIKIQEQIKQMHNQRKLPQQLQKIQKLNQSGIKQNDQNKIVKLMNDLMQEYNNIIQYRKVNKQIAGQKIIKSSSHSNQLNQNIINKIKQQQQKFSQQNDLSNQIKLNKNVVQIYKQYVGQKKQKPNSSMEFYKKISYLPVSKSSKSQKRIISTRQNIQPDQQLKHQYADIKKFLSVNQNLQTNVRKTSFNEKNVFFDKFKQEEYKKLKQNKKKLANSNVLPPKNKQMNRKNSFIQQKSQILKMIQQPFENKNQIKKFKQMQNKIYNQKQAIDSILVKINQIEQKDKNKKNKSKNKNQNQIKQEQIKQQRQQQVQNFIDKQLKMIKFISSQEYAKSYLQFTKTKSKQLQQTQEEVCGKFLKNRHNKFNKLWGTKILVKYDEKKQAQLLLSGRSDNNPNSKSNSFRKQDKSKSFTSKFSNPTNKQLDLDEEDEEHYWRMCKNQKINLLLKKR